MKHNAGAAPLHKTNVVTILALTIVSLGILVLAGWAWEIDTFIRLWPGLVSMKANTAFGFVLAGSSLLLISRPQSHPAMHNGGRLLALLVALLGLVTMAEYLFGWNAGIDQLFFSEMTGQVPYTPVPGRMSVITAMNFTVMGMALLLLSFQRLWVFIQILVLVSAVTVVLPLGRFMLGDPSFPHIGSTSATATHTVLGFLLMIAGILMATSDHGLLWRWRAYLPVAGLVTAMALLIFAFVASFHGITQREETSMRIDRIHNLLVKLESLSADLHTLDKTDWEFLITGQEIYLRQATTIAKNLSEDLAKTRHMEINNPVIHEQLGEVSELIERRIALGREYVQVRREKGTAAALTLLASGESHALINQIDQKLGETQRRIESMLQAQQKTTGIRKVANLIDGTIVGLLSFALIIIIFARLRREITVRKRKEVLLQQQANLIELAPVALIVCDMETRIVYWNHGAEELYGWTRSEALGKLVSQLLQTRLPCSREKIRQAMSTTGYWQGEVEHTHRDGTRLIVSSRWALQHDSDGRAIAILKINENITTRKEMEHRQRQVLDSLYVFVGLISPDGTLLDLNEAPLRAANLRREDVIGRTFWETYWTAYSQDSKKLYESLFLRATAGEMVRQDVKVRVQGGLLIDMDATFSPMYDTAGKIINVIGSGVDITARKTMENELRTEAQRMDFLLAASPAVIYSCAPAGNYALTYISPNLREQFGYSPEEFLRDPDFWVKNIHPDDAPRIIKELAALLEHDTYTHQYRFRMPDGSFHWVQDDQRLVRYTYGIPKEIIGSLRDINTTRYIEERQRQNLDLLKEAQRIANLGNWELNLVTNLLVWSDEVYRIFEIDKNRFDASYEAFLNLVHPEDRDKVNNAYNISLKTRTPYEITHRLLMPDGRIKWVIERCHTFSDENGNPFRSIGTVQDITLQYNTRLELQTGRAVTDELFANLQGMVYRCKNDPDWTMEFVSEGITPLTGYTPREFVEERSIRFGQLIYPDDTQMVWDKVQEALNKREPYNLFYRIRTRASDIKWVTERGHGVFTDDGQLLYLQGLIIDDTQRVLAEGASQAKSEFLSRMSHELRTPMNAIIGFSQLLEMELEEPEQRDSVREIQRASHHLLDLINELLDLSRIEAGRLHVTLEPLNPATVVTEAVNLVRQLVENKHLLLHNQTAPAHSLPVVADPTRLRQVLVNLLSNAAKYNKQGGSIRVDCTPLDEQHLRLSVTDTGPGIAPDKQPLLFQPFERLGAEATQVEGTGIGLALSKRLV